MNTPNKILLSALIVLVLFVVAFKFQQFFLNRDYILYVNADCNPETDSCFQMDCSEAEEGDCDLFTYKKLELSARNAPTCLLNRECLNYSCGEYDLNCQEVYCENATLEEGEMCVGLDN